MCLPIEKWLLGISFTPLFIVTVQITTVPMSWINLRHIKKTFQ
jgi:hypothetical protein